MVQLKKTAMTLLALMACVSLQASDKNPELRMERFFQVNKDFLSSVKQGNKEKVLITVQSFENLFEDFETMELCYPVFINQRDKAGKPALYHAVNSNYDNVACLLLQLGANSRCVDKDSARLEDIARKNGNAYLQGILIDANADYIKSNHKKQKN